MDYLSKFDREVDKFCMRNHAAKHKMKEKLTISGRNQAGHFVAGKPVKEVYERFSVRDDFIEESPGGNVSILGNPVNSYFTQTYPLPTTLADLALPTQAQRASLERMRRSKEMQEVRPAEIGFTGLPGRPRHVPLNIPYDIELRQMYYRAFDRPLDDPSKFPGLLPVPPPISRGASAASGTTLSDASTSFAM